jgi:hypothetical protein
MLILECSKGCYVVKIWPGDIDLWPRKSIGFQILLRTKYKPSLFKIHWRMLILECSQGCDGRTHPCEHSRINILKWILTKLGTYLVLRKIWNPIDFQGQRSMSPGQIFLNDVDSRVFTRMLCSKHLTWWHWPLTLKINRVPDTSKD